MKQHILFVHANKSELINFLDVLRDVPDEDGFKCSYAEDTRQALDMLKYLVPQVIFLDGTATPETGLSFLSTIKTQARFQHTRVYFYSSIMNETGRNEALRLGALGVVDNACQRYLLGDQLRSIFQTSLLAKYNTVAKSGMLYNNQA